MATRAAGVGLQGVEKFDSLSRQIEETFSQYHSLLDTHKHKLLEEVNRVKELFLVHRDLDKSIQQMEGVIRATNEMVTENLVAGNKEQIVGLWEENIRKLRIRKDNLEAVSDLKFLSNTEELTQSINKIHLRDRMCEQYSKRREPIVMKGRRGAGDGEIGDVRAIAVDRENDLVYVTDDFKDLVCVYSIDGDFVRKFGEKLNYPNGICLSKEFVFVSNTGTKSIIKFSKAGKYLSESKDYQLERSSNMYTYNNQRVYACNSKQLRIDILGFDLKYIGNLSQEELLGSNPSDISIHNNTIFVLTGVNMKIHTFSTEHVYLTTIKLSRCNPQSFVTCLTVDKNGNIIVTNHDKHVNYCVNVFSSSGQFIQSLGCGYITRPRGIGVDRHNRIILLSNSPLHCFQVY